MSTPSTQESLRPVVGIWRYLFILGGLIFVGIAYLGVLLPGLPTTPWLLLASYCFARSSPRLQRWLLRSPVFGKLLHDWHTHRGIRRPVKVTAIAIIIPVVSLSITFGGLPFFAKVAIGACALVGISVILFVVPTIPRDTHRADPAAAPTHHSNSEPADLGGVLPKS